ncbi:Glycosyltransferase involved in cell wall bisynthesis [Pedococcus cremeus]|uniref:D-inositol 3-phosphate glycosyltransferase n=1 Tax=Pedococcus cremeus TaxID=587636 RepID=A0A1H9RKR6_9MICO|nr:glycosyltransferase family 4 protein [Pedococcus cremeus]SER73178.1 Glycosyltransferase involved in cell wall bisynthesis [Pedococcus cremeus]
MKIAMVTQWYDPEGSSAALPGVISRALRREGHEVHVLTGFPNYPTGTLLPGYRVRPYMREDIKGVTVHRAPLFPSHDSRASRRALNYLSFAAGAAAVAVTRLPKVEAVLVHGTPATAAIPALALESLRGTPFVFHVQDLWPQTVVNAGFLTGGTSRVERILHRYCDLVYRRASTVAVIAPGMVEQIAQRGVSDDKLEIVPNWADEAAFRPAEKNQNLADSFGLDRPFTVMYAGIFGKYQNLGVLLDAARELRDRRDIGFALVGGGVEERRLRDRVAAEQLDNVRFVPMQPFDQMTDVLALGDVQLVSLQDLPLFRSTLPSKLQATLAAGRPIIGAVVGDAADVIRDSRSGITVTPGSTIEMVEAITTLAGMGRTEREKLGEQGRGYYLDNFSEKVAVERLTGLLERAAEGSQR